MTATILRTADQGCFEIYEGAWGSYLRSTFDPDANVEITEDNLKQFELKTDINKIPAELWQAWVQLCFHYVEKVPANLEVSVRILRNDDDHSQYRIIVPKQKVSGAAVRVDSFDLAVDIVTGEEIQSYPPSGWTPVGSSHSHNSMPAFFSGTDDQFELKDPGIHIVVGGINSTNRNYNIASSVVGSGRRFLVDYNALIDATPISGVTFHENVLDYIEIEKPKATTLWTPKGQSNNGNTRNTSIYQQWHNRLHNSNVRDDFNDPFFFQDGFVNSEYWDAFDREGTESKSSDDDVSSWNIKDAIQDYMLDNRISEEEIAGFIQMMTPIVAYIRKHSKNPAKMMALHTIIKGQMTDLEIWGSELLTTKS